MYRYSSIFSWQSNSGIDYHRHEHLEKDVGSVFDRDRLFEICLWQSRQFWWIMLVLAYDKLPDHTHVRPQIRNSTIKTSVSTLFGTRQASAATKALAAFLSRPPFTHHPSRGDRQYCCIRHPRSAPSTDTPLSRSPARPAAGRDWYASPFCASLT